MNRAARRRLAIAGSVLCTAAVMTTSTALAVMAKTTATPSWHTFRLVSENSYQTLLALTATGPADAWAFGDGLRSPIAVHWNGLAWTASRIPRANARPELVSSTARTNVWVSGHVCDSWPPSAYVSRWNGSSWSTTSISHLPFCSSNMVTSGPKEGWLFGSGGYRAMHFTRTGMHLVSLGITGQVLAAAAVSANDVWAFASNFPGIKSYALHWNGSRWRSIPLPALPLGNGGFISFDDAVAVSAENVWVTALALPKRPFSLLLHWNGRSWQRVYVPGTKDLYQITTDGAGGLWIIGWTPSTNTYTFMHYAGGHWSVDPAPTSGLPHEQPGSAYFEIYAIARIPGTTSIWATGQVHYTDTTLGGGVNYTVFFKYGP